MPRDRRARACDRVPKLCGADIELGNFILGGDRPGGSAREASRALLREIEPTYATDAAGTKTYDPQDWGRRYLRSNGGCFYIDLDHLECCLPEVLSAHDHVAAWHAMLRIARRALAAANAKLPPGESLHVLVNNSDGRGNAYGSHLDFLVSRRLWDDIFETRIQYLLLLAAFQASSIVFTGQGKVGAENGRPRVAFQLSQRADFFETLVGAQTTQRRPLVNSRDEALCGRAEREPATRLARLHSIFFDNTLCHGSSLLKVGTMQLVLGLLEAGHASASLILDDPLTALLRWSRDPSLRVRARTLAGRMLTAVELQLLFLERAQRFAAAGGYEGTVPRAQEILRVWEETLLALQRRDLDAAARRVDWALKLHIIAQAMARRPDLGWTSPEVKHLDHLYSSLDAASGLYWAYEAADAVERLVSDDAIERFVHEPPDDTRAWGRAMLLRIARPGRVDAVDWDRITFRRFDRGYWPTVHTIHMGDPLGFTRAAIGDVVDAASSLDDVLAALRTSPPRAEATPTLSQWLEGAAQEDKEDDDGNARTRTGTTRSAGNGTDADCGRQ